MTSLPVPVCVKKQKKESLGVRVGGVCTCEHLPREQIIEFDPIVAL